MKLFRILTIVITTCALAACEPKSSVEGGSDAAQSGNDAQTGDTAGGDATSADASGNDTVAADASGGDIAADAGGDVVATPGIYGTYSSAFGGYEEVSATAWDEMTIVKLDAAARIAITQNPADDPYNPSKFNKIVWTTPKGGSFYYCYVDYGLATADLASATTKTADDSAPDTKGCGGFSWTKLTATAPIAIAGKYNDNFGGKSIVSSRWWDTASMQKFDSTLRWAITQNAANDPYNPSKFAKVVWTAPTAGSFYTCMVDYGLDSADLAMATTKTADDSAPDKSGCGGFSWTKLTPQ